MANKSYIAVGASAPPRDGSTPSANETYLSTGAAQVDSPVSLVLDNKQSNTATITDGNSSVNVTVTSVVTTKSVLLFSVKSSNADPSNHEVTGIVSNATTLVFARNGTTGDVTIEWQLLEFSSGIRVQHFSIDPPTDATTDQAIDTVDLTKAFPILTYHNSGTTRGSDNALTAEITTPTNLQIKVNGSPTLSNMHLACQVVEIDDAEVQKLTGTLDTDGETDVTISAVDLSKTFWFWTMQSDGNFNNDDTPIAVADTTTNIKFQNVATTGLPARPYVLYVVEVANDVTVQNVTATIASSGTSKSETISSVTTSETAVLSNGWYQQWGKSSDTTDASGPNQTTVDLDSSTQITVTRGSADSATCTTHVQVIEFGTTAVTGTGAIDATVPELAGSGTVAGYVGTGAIDATVPTLSGSGTVIPPPVTGTGAIDATVPTLDGSGTVVGYVGTGAIDATVPTLSGSGSFIPGPVSGTGAISATVPTLAGVGAITGLANIVTGDSYATLTVTGKSKVL